MHSKVTQECTAVIADSHAIVREGITGRLQDSSLVGKVFEADDGYSAIRECKVNDADVLVLDYSICRPSGREVLLKVAQRCPDTKIIVVSSEMNAAAAHFALSNGAVAYIPKQSKGGDFVDAVKAALRGFTYLPADFILEFVESRKNLTRTGNVFGLSPREVEILDACVQGQSTKQVAHNFSISVRTVETHRNNIYKKTACNNIDDLAMLMAS